MVTLTDALNDLDDLKSALYDIVEGGLLNENINDQVQELLREAYSLLEDEVQYNTTHKIAQQCAIFFGYAQPQAKAIEI